MPLFEYVCSDCKHEFEALVMGSRKPECPACHSKKLEQQLSVFAARSSSGTSSARASAGPCGSCGNPNGPGSCQFDS
jgi:putative FmdB family regulatory protein